MRIKRLTSDHETGGITRLVKDLIQSSDLEELARHTLNFYARALSELDQRRDLLMAVVFRSSESTGYRVYQARGWKADEFLGLELDPADWPARVWNDLAQGLSREELELKKNWFRGDAEVSGPVHLETIPMLKKGTRTPGFVLILSPNPFKVQEYFRTTAAECGEIVSEMISLKREARTVEHQLDAFELIDDFYRRMNQSQDVQQTLEYCLKTFQKLFDASSGSVMVYDSDRDTMQVSYTTAPVRRDPMEFELGEGIAGRALAEDKIYLVPNVQKSVFFKEYGDEEQDTDVKSLVSIPLNTAHSQVGVVNIVDHDEYRRFDFERVPGFQLVRDRIAAALENLFLQNELRTVASTDELTGLYNRRYVNRTLEDHLEELRQQDKPFSVILIDLDDFKQINDRHGHSTGDRVLVRFAEHLLEKRRSQDIVGRYGGDEFIYILPATLLDQATDVARSLVATLQSLDVGTKSGDQITPQASLGVTTASPERPPADLEDLLRKADHELYRAKETPSSCVKSPA